MSQNSEAPSLSAIRTAAVVLGETTYTVREASHLRAKKVWPILVNQVKPALESLRETGDISSDSTLADLAGLVPVIERILLELPDAIVEFICGYDPGLEAARKNIEETATQRQLILALLALLEMSDPFGLRRLVSRGLTRTAHSSSSPAPSGE